MALMLQRLSTSVSKKEAESSFQ